MEKNLPQFDYGGSMPLTEEEYSRRKKTIKRIWPNRVEDTSEEEMVFSDEQLLAVTTFFNELPSKLSDPGWLQETKSAYMTLCDELEVPIDARDRLREQALSKEQESNIGGE